MVLSGIYSIGNEHNYLNLAQIIKYPTLTRMMGEAFPIGFDPLDGQLFLMSTAEHAGQISYCPWDELADQNVQPNLLLCGTGYSAFREAVSAVNVRLAPT